MARRSIIASGSLKGYLLEEVVASLIRNAGYRLLLNPQDDPHDLTSMGNGLQVRGRGGYHQADVLGELIWAPAFGSPIRLFIEAKWRGSGQAKIGIPEVRHAVGILQDVNQVLVTVGAPVAADGTSGEDIRGSGRGYCYAYRYALCSASGFTAGAQAYALAHQVALLDLSHQDYEFLRDEVDKVGDELHEYLERRADQNLSGPNGLRGSTVQSIRSTLRAYLWGRGIRDVRRTYADVNQRFRRILEPLIEAANNIEELFVGVSATGFVILLKADHPDRMVRHMRADQDPWTDIHWRTEEDGSLAWSIRVSSDETESCNLTFALPEAMLRVLEEQAERRRSAALDLKEEHFSRITIYRITDTKSMICSLKLSASWLERARRDLETRARRRPT